MDTTNIDLKIDAQTLREAQRLTGARSRHEALQRAVEIGVHTLRYEASLKPRLAAVRRLEQALRGPLKRIRSAKALRKAAGI